MDKAQELELRTSVKKLELSHQNTSLAIKIGWIPFVVIAWIINTITETFLVYSFDLDPTKVITICFVSLIISLIAFYAFAFQRNVKIGAELSEKKALLEMESGYQ